MIDGEKPNDVDEYIEELRKQSEALRATAEVCDRQIDVLDKLKELAKKHGVLMPSVMQSTEFVVRQIAAVAGSKEEVPTELFVPETPHEVGKRIAILRPQVRGSSSRERRPDQVRNYNIASLVKPIMSGIFGGGKEEVPEDLDSLFDKMYGQNWHSRTVDVPTGPSLSPLSRTYLEDLHSGESYIIRLIAGADKVINRNMRGNTTPAFPYRGRVAAVELVQLYNKIDTVGWDVYDDFMVRNRIRQPKTS